MSYVGLFGWTGPGGDLNNLKLIDVEIYGAFAVGSLIGHNEGNISDSSTTGNVTGGTQVGGLAGRLLSGTTLNCIAAGNVTGGSLVGGLFGVSEGTILSSYTTGNVTGYHEVGGLVGCSEGTISNSYSTGNVTGHELVGGLVGTACFLPISDSYATGSVNGESCVGGLVGINACCEVISSYWDINASGQTTSAGGEGRTTEQMHQQATFVGWDFVDVWTIREGSDYPKLKWQPLSDPSQLIANLVQDVIVLNIQKGIANSLDSKLESALRALDDLNENNDVAAVNSLQAFINFVEAQRGDKISEEDADTLVAAALVIIDSLMGE